MGHELLLLLALLGLAPLGLAPLGLMLWLAPVGLGWREVKSFC